jgi:hypothetical protein
MSTIAIAPRHIKVRATAGEVALERCEDVGCTVGEGGHADCGRLACPACGCGGGNLAPGERGELVFCSCGHSFVADW